VNLSQPVRHMESADVPTTEKPMMDAPLAKELPMAEMVSLAAATYQEIARLEPRINESAVKLVDAILANKSAQNMFFSARQKMSEDIPSIGDPVWGLGNVIAHTQFSEELHQSGTISRIDNGINCTNASASLPYWIGDADFWRNNPAGPEGWDLMEDPVPGAPPMKVRDSPTSSILWPYTRVIEGDFGQRPMGDATIWATAKLATKDGVVSTDLTRALRSYARTATNRNILDWLRVATESDTKLSVVLPIMKLLLTQTTAMPIAGTADTDYSNVFRIQSREQLRLQSMCIVDAADPRYAAGAVIPNACSTWPMQNNTVPVNSALGYPVILATGRMRACSETRFLEIMQGQYVPNDASYVRTMLGTQTAVIPVTRDEMAWASNSPIQFFLWVASWMAHPFTFFASKDQTYTSIHRYTRVVGAAAPLTGMSGWEGVAISNSNFVELPGPMGNVLFVVMGDPNISGEFSLTVQKNVFRVVEPAWGARAAQVTVLCVDDNFSAFAAHPAGVGTAQNELPTTNLLNTAFRSLSGVATVWNAGGAARVQDLIPALDWWKRFASDNDVSTCEALLAEWTLHWDAAPMRGMSDYRYQQVPTRVIQFNDNNVYSWGTKPALCPGWQIRPAGGGVQIGFNLATLGGELAPSLDKVDANGVTEWSVGGELLTRLFRTSACGARWGLRVYDFSLGNNTELMSQVASFPTPGYPVELQAGTADICVEAEPWVVPAFNWVAVMQSIAGAFGNMLGPKEWNFSRKTPFVTRAAPAAIPMAILGDMVLEGRIGLADFMPVTAIDIGGTGAEVPCYSAANTRVTVRHALNILKHAVHPGYYIAPGIRPSAVVAPHGGTNDTYVNVSITSLGRVLTGVWRSPAIGPGLDWNYRYLNGALTTGGISYFTNGPPYADVLRPYQREMLAAEPDALTAFEPLSSNKFWFEPFDTQDMIVPRTTTEPLPVVVRVAPTEKRNVVIVQKDNWRQVMRAACSIARDSPYVAIALTYGPVSGFTESGRLNIVPYFKDEYTALLAQTLCLFPIQINGVQPSNYRNRRSTVASVVPDDYVVAAFMNGEWTVTATQNGFDQWYPTTPWHQSPLITSANRKTTIREMVTPLLSPFPTAGKYLTVAFKKNFWQLMRVHANVGATGNGFMLKVPTPKTGVEGTQDGEVHSAGAETFL
jgi:hypothetical protein